MGGNTMLNFRVEQIEYGRWQLTDGDAVRVKPRFGGGWVWRLSAPAQGDSEDDRNPLTLGNLSSCHLGKNKAKNNDKTRFPREDDKLISLKGNLSPSAPQDADAPGAPTIFAIICANPP